MILSSFTHSQVAPNLYELLFLLNPKEDILKNVGNQRSFVFGIQFKIFWMACDCPIDCQVNNTVKAQKSMKDIVKIRKLCIRVVRLIQNSIRSLRPADIVQNSATLKRRRRIVE